MKTLLFLLFAFSCNAQEGMTQSEIYLMTSERLRNYHKDCNIPQCDHRVSYQGYFATPVETPCINLYDLLEYERECYNDSTEYDCITIWFDGQDEGYTIEYDDDPRVVYFGDKKNVGKCWRHREPTFTGFIQWLKNRMK